MSRIRHESKLFNLHRTRGNGDRRPSGRRVAAVLTALLLSIAGVFATAGAAQADVGVDWTLRQTPELGMWRSVAYGNGTWVAVANQNASGTTRVMTSPDGITWTARPGATGVFWSVAYGGGTFVMTGASAVLTSTDGISWTSRTPTALYIWKDVTYGCPTAQTCRFVATGSNATENGIMTSPNGVTWTAATNPAAYGWGSVTYGCPTPQTCRFVTITNATGSGTSRAMWSPDGDTWNVVSGTPSNSWQRVTYGNGIFVAVSSDGSPNQAMRSTDGALTWTSGTTPIDPGVGGQSWQGVAYGNGMFVAVASTGTNDRVMTSVDGNAWTHRVTPNPTVGAELRWWNVTFANGMFVAVSLSNGTSTQEVMTSNPLFLTQAGNVLKTVPASGSTPTQYRIQYKPTGGSRWGAWGTDWAGTVLGSTVQTLSADNTFDVNLATYQAAGSCTTVSTGSGFMLATQCPRAYGEFTSGAMDFRTRVNNGGVWSDTPTTSITR